MDLNLDPSSRYRNDDLILSIAAASNRHYNIQFDSIPKRCCGRLLLAVGPVASASVAKIFPAESKRLGNDQIRIQVAEAAQDLIAICPDDNLIDDSALAEVAQRLVESIQFESIVILCTVAQGRFLSETDEVDQPELYHISTETADCPVGRCPRFPIPNFITGLAAAVFTASHCRGLPACAFISVVKNLSAIDAALSFRTVLQYYVNTNLLVTRDDIISSGLLPASCDEPLEIFM